MTPICFDEIRQALGREDISDQEIRDIVSVLDRRRQEKWRQGELEDLGEHLRNHAEKLSREVREAAIIEKRNKAINIMRRQEVLDLVGRFDDPATGLEAAMVGTNEPVQGARLSVDARHHAIRGKYLGGMVADLEREGLLEVFNTRTLDREIAQELWEIRPDGKPGMSGSREAQGIARIIHKFQETARVRQNRAGGWIRSMPGYIVRQSHDMARIRRAGFEAWRDFILPRLDPEETFKGADPDVFLRGAYDGLVTGRHLKVKGAQEGSDRLLGFKGPGNLAKRISQERVLHFKAADDWFDYNQRFGSRSLTEAVVSGLDRAAQNTALMEAFGPNPRAMFDNVLDRLKDQYRGDPETFDRLASRRLQNQFAEIDGTTRIPANYTMAKAGRVLRAWQNMSKLGGAVLSAFADVPAFASEMRYQGMNLLEAYYRGFENVLKGRRSGEQREIAELIGVGLDSMIGDVVSRFSATDDLPGIMAKTQQTFFKLSLLNWWTDSQKTGVGMMMSRHLAMQRAKIWNQLDARLRRVLGLYDIDAGKWELIRSSAVREVDGVTYIMPDAVQDLPDQLVHQYMADQGILELKIEPTPQRMAKIQQFKDRLETSLQAYFVDRADFAIPTPGAREFAIMRQGTQPGTPLGEAVRFVMQFKSFPISFITKPLSRELYGQGAKTFAQALFKGRGDILGLTHLIVATTVMGYLAKSAKDLSKGRTPRDPREVKTWLAAFQQGGGAGIYGDFLFGEYDRFGHGLWASVLGPTAGVTADVADIFTRLKRGDDVAATTFRTAVNNTPFINLFYTRAALDYLLLYQIQEHLNPGYLRRMEKNIKKHNAQTFILPPSKQIPRGGGTKLLEGVR